MVPRNKKKEKGDGGRGRLALLQTVMNAFRVRRTRREKTRSGGFVFSFAVTSQDLLFRCSEQFLTGGRSYQKQSFLLLPTPAPSASTTPTRPPTSRGLHFLRRGGGGACYERTNIVLTRTCLPRSLEKGYRRTVVGFLTPGVHLRVS